MNHLEDIQSSPAVKWSRMLGQDIPAAKLAQLTSKKNLGYSSLSLSLVL